ncbi:MAG: recombinase family protein [Firmicutes bacterium]|nr:recombinase family protein [Bacillota bacterium]
MRIAAYCRVSTLIGEQIDSLENQKTFFGEYAAKHNYNLVRLYPDEGVSGKQIKKREKFLQMMGDAKLGLFDMVVVKDISRFARNTVDFLNSIRQLKALGIGVQFLSNNQTSLGDSEFVLTIFSALAQEESANLSKRVKFGKNLNAQKGKVPNLVFGYNHIDRFTLEVNEAEAEIVRLIYRMYVEDGLGGLKIAQYLRENTAVRPKRNGRWSQTGVMEILKNELYIGVVITKQSEVVDFITGKRREMKENERIRTDKPELAIVPKELFDAAQAMRDNRQDLFKINRERHSNRFVFSTMLKCEHCGYSFRRFHRQNMSTSYRKWACCGKYQKICDNAMLLDEKEVLDEIIEYFKSIIGDKDAFIKAALQECRDHVPPTDREEDLDKLKKELARLRGAKEKAMDMYTNDIITMEELRERTEKLNQTISALSEKVKSAEVLATTQVLTENAVEKGLQKVLGNIEHIITEPNISNHLLKQVIEKITVSSTGEIKIHIKRFE